MAVSEAENAVCLPQRRSRGLKKEHLVQYRAPVTINVALLPEDAQPAEHPAKRRLPGAVAKGAAMLVVGSLLLTAVVVLCLHYLRPAGADVASPLAGFSSDAPPPPPPPPAGANSTAAPAEETSAGGGATSRPTAAADDGPGADSCGQPARMFQCDEPAEECRRYYDRAAWGARPPSKLVPMARPIRYVVVSHTTLPRCASLPACGKQLRSMQAFHQSRGYDDLSYNFLVADDGSVYEGRGWRRASSHLGRRGDSALGLGFLGDYGRYDLTEMQVGSAGILLDHGLRCGYLDGDYQLVAHNQTRSTSSPGRFVFQRMKHWSHYSNATLFLQT